MVELERNLDLRVIPFLEGSALTKSEEDRTMIDIVKEMGLNLATLPL